MAHGAATTSETLSRELEREPRHSLVEACLFVAFRADAPASAYSRHGLGGVQEVHLRRGKKRETQRIGDGSRRTLVLSIPDRCLSGMHARILRSGSAFLLEDGGSKNGTWLNGRRVTSSSLPGNALIEVGNTFLFFKNDVPLPRDGASDHTVDVDACEALATLSPALGRTFDLLGEVATSVMPVLVSGETGSGKEVVMTALHRMSRRTGALVAVNCGGLPTTLIESELFGFRKGSFSGAVEDRLGLVRAAESGTLFLDEIGDLPLTAQATLLRVLQDRRVTPIGGVSPVDVDFRVVSATHRSLEELSQRRLFREDLLARLSGLRVHLPPLRDRKEDLGLLVSRLLARRAEHRSLSFTPEAVRCLFSHSWPGNVRELERRLALAAILAKQGRIEREHFSDGVIPGDRTGTSSAAGPASPRTGLPPLEPEDAARRARMIALLREHGGNVTAVAAAMGKARAQVQRWMRRYGIDRRALSHALDLEDMKGSWESESA